MFFWCPEFSQFHLKSGWMKGWQLLELEGFMMLYWQVNCQTCCNWKCPVNPPQRPPIFTPGVPAWQSPNKFRQNHQGLHLVSTLQYQLWSSKNHPNIPPHNQISPHTCYLSQVTCQWQFRALRQHAGHVFRSHIANKVHRSVQLCHLTESWVTDLVVKLKDPKGILASLGSLVDVSNDEIDQILFFPQVTEVFFWRHWQTYSISSAP